jgi:gamma-glutamylaminecyclotransferase
MTGRFHRVFVYGSLRRGLANHRLLAGAAFEGVCRTASGFRLYDLGPFPAMVAAEHGRVLGELYTADDATLARLDRLENHPRWYCRTAIGLADGRRVETYLLPLGQVCDRPVIPSGDWVAYLESRADRRL